MVSNVVVDDHRNGGCVMNVTNVIADILKEEGVEYLFGFPSHLLFDAEAAEAGIRTIVVRQEWTGVQMADVLGRATSGKRVATFTFQYGPGTENPFDGVAQASWWI